MKIDHFSWYNSGWSSLLVADSMAWWSHKPEYSFQVSIKFPSIIYFVYCIFTYSHIWIWKLVRGGVLSGLIHRDTDHIEVCLSFLVMPKARDSATGQSNRDRDREREQGIKREIRNTDNQKITHPNSHQNLMRDF